MILRQDPKSYGTCSNAAEIDYNLMPGTQIYLVRRRKSNEERSFGYWTLSKFSCNSNTKGECEARPLRVRKKGCGLGECVAWGECQESDRKAFSPQA